MNRSPRLLKIALVFSGVAVLLLGVAALDRRPLAGTVPTPDRSGGTGLASTSDPLLLTVAAQNETQTALLLPTSTATPPAPTPKPTPLDWCDPSDPRPGERCTWPNLTPAPTAVPPKPTATPVPCGAGAVAGKACVWPYPTAWADDTPTASGERVGQ